MQAVLQWFKHGVSHSHMQTHGISTIGVKVQKLLGLWQGEEFTFETIEHNNLAHPGQKGSVFGEFYQKSK